MATKIKYQIEVLGKADKELRCQNPECSEADWDVSVNPDTGICSECGAEHEIVETEITYTP